MIDVRWVVGERRCLLRVFFCVDRPSKQENTLAFLERAQRWDANGES